MKKKLVHKIISVIVILMMVMSSAAISFADTDSAASSNQKALKQATAEKEAAAEEAAEKEAAEKEAAAKAEAERIAAEKAEAERIAEEEKAAAEREAAEKEAAEKAAAEKEAAEKAAAEKDAADKDAAEKESKNSVRDASEPKAEKKSKEEKSEADSDKAIQESKKNRKGTGEKALSNGTYAVENFEFSGGTGKAKLTCESVIVKDGKAYAVFSASSANMTHVYMGEAPSSDETTSLYDPKTGAMGKDVYRIIDQITYAPVELNESKPVAARTTAMSEPHWVQYQYKITLSAQAQKVSSDTTIPDKYASSGGGNPETGNITLSDGTYKVSNFSFSGGTGKTNWTCDNVIIAGGKAYAAMQCSSANMTHIYMGTAGTTDEDKTLYDPDKDQGKAGVYRMILQTAWVPVVLNQNFPMAGRSTAMSDPHWIQYQCNITLAKDAEKVSDNATVPEGYAVDAFGDGGGDNPGGNPGGQEGGNEPSSPADPTPSTTSKLSDGTWKVKATTDRKMFYLYPKETNPAQVILVKKGNSMTATITLTGDGYDYVYMGTPAQAKRAGIKNWIKAKIVNGYYTFTIPVSALDKKLAITPHSKKYETDANPATDPWRPDKWIIFYSAGAVKVKDGTTVTPTKSKSSKQKTSGNATSGTQGKVKLTDKKKDKVSKWKDDSGKSTSAVNNKTSLKDGVYAPDRFSWSGGSGRLAYIKCTKITVTGGKSYATIVFGSTKYDSLKAAGRVFSKSGGGNSTFTIPIKLNANNTIIGRTTAMSQPHWVKYNIFVYKKGASGTSGDTAKGDDGHVTSTKKLSDKAPDLMGLKQKKGKALEKAEYFRIFRYEKGITLISVDQTKDTALYKKENKNSKKAKQNEDNQPKVEYDEEGKPIARSQNQITEELYKNNVVNYLIVPKGIEIPAGLYKDCIIINQPVHNTYVFSGDMMETICELGLADKIALAGIREEDVKGEAAQKALSGSRMLLTGDTEKPDYAAMVKNKVDLAVLPDDVLPEKVKKEEKSLFGSDDSEKAQEEAKKKEKTLGVMQKRFAALNVPMLILRDADEKTNYGQAEWIKVFGAIYGEDAKADKAFQKFKKSHKEKKLNKKEENQKDQKNEEK